MKIYKLYTRDKEHPEEVYVDIVILDKKGRFIPGTCKDYVKGDAGGAGYYRFQFYSPAADFGRGNNCREVFVSSEKLDEAEIINVEF